MRDSPEFWSRMGIDILIVGPAGAAIGSAYGYAWGHLWFPILIGVLVAISLWGLIQYDRYERRWAASRNLWVSGGAIQVGAGKNASGRGGTATIYLRELKPREVTSFTEIAEPRTLANIRLEHSLSTHPVEIGPQRFVAHIAYDIPAGFAFLFGSVAIADLPNDIRCASGPHVFRISSNGAMLWTSRALQQSGEFEKFRVPVSGGQT